MVKGELIGRSGYCANGQSRGALRVRYAPRQAWQAGAVAIADGSVFADGARVYLAGDMSVGLIAAAI
jgi:hypothetical protein